MIKKFFVFLSISLSLYACKDDDPNLPSVDERVEAAISDLSDQLTSPTNGWRLNYQPTSASGSFLIILEFNEDGTVKISSDLAANEGAFFEQTITYRIDAGLSLELIFETYAVFHYMFELDNASYGAEFEFLFDEEEGGNLYFTSKSDVSDVSTIVFLPATSEDLEALSREIAANFDVFAGQSPTLFGGADPTQHLYLSDVDFSVFWQIDLNKRTVLFDIAGSGATIDEVIAGNYQSLQVESGYTFENGKLVFSSPASFTINGKTNVLSEITLGTFSEDGEPLCPEDSETTPVYTATVSGLGNATIRKNLFSSGGLGFEAGPDMIYSVNVLYVLDQDLNSLSETGSIANYFPNASGFIMTYGYESDSIPENAIGLIVEGEDGFSELYLRAFTPSASGNALGVTLLDEFYYTSTPTDEEIIGLKEITEEIFAGGIVYAYDLPVSGLTAFQFYNPCNDYEFVLVQ